MGPLAGQLLDERGDLGEHLGHEQAGARLGSARQPLAGAVDVGDAAALRRAAAKKTASGGPSALGGAGVKPARAPPRRGDRVAEAESGAERGAGGDGARRRGRLAPLDARAADPEQVEDRRPGGRDGERAAEQEQARQGAGAARRRQARRGAGVGGSAAIRAREDGGGQVRRRRPRRVQDAQLALELSTPASPGRRAAGRGRATCGT